MFSRQAFVAEFKDKQLKIYSKAQQRKPDRIATQPL